MKLRVAAVRALFVVVAGASVVAAGALAACKSPAPVSAADISGVDWHLESDRNANFRIDDGQLRGTDSCNRIFGAVTVADGDPVTINFDALGATRMACPDDTNAQEDMGRALVGERHVEKPNSETLLLVDGASGERWRFEK